MSFLANLLSLILVGVTLAANSPDLNGDGIVDTADLTILKSQWGGTGTADLNQDSTVNARDAGILLSSWGTIPTTPPPPPPSGTRDPFLWPYDTHSPWNMPIGTGATYASIASNPTWNGVNIYVDAPSAVEVFRGSSSDPLRNVYVDGSTNSWVTHNPDPNSPTFCNLSKLAPGTLGGTFNIPDNAQSSSAGDRVMVGLEPNGRYYNVFYYARKTPSPNWTVTGLFNNDIRLDGWSAFKCIHGGRASGASWFGGLIRKGELTNGIKHALVAQIGGNLMNKYWIWPASWSDVSVYPGYNPNSNVVEGTLLAIPATVNIDTAGFQTPQGKVIARTMQLYGLYIADGATDNIFTISLTRDTIPEVPSQNSGDPFKQDMKLAVQLLRIVSNNGSNSVGGGGSPLAPLAPPFAP